ncbi:MULTISPECIES: type IV secretion protein Rhs [unclassified Atlantibacter]|uniref:type IV secretion protein Rhs n=1 Tax=unclassified Atlantibacter TaxID=2649394 RepID=UPI001606A9F7|nr:MULTISPECIES: type IV secretion protein Rhs [unclassified Atlantibacter]MBB3321049.1 hypothetical protein [Atlantibacter sp. RC6]
METAQEQEGSLRRLTAGEIELARWVFMSTVPYHRVWIHCDSYLPFNLQDDHTAMTPNGEIYFRFPLYRDDFSKSLPDMQHLFIHEMVHIWQREKGMNVILRGLVSWYVSYRYRLDGRLLSEYPMEQQAQIIADNFTLKREGYRGWCNLIRSHDVTLDGDISESAIRRQYRHVLREFPWH